MNCIFFHSVGYFFHFHDNAFECAKVLSVGYFQFIYFLLEFLLIFTAKMKAVKTQIFGFSSKTFSFISYILTFEPLKVNFL